MYHAKLNPKSTRRNVCGMYIPNCGGVMRGPKPQGLSAGLTFHGDPPVSRSPPARHPGISTGEQSLQTRPDQTAYHDPR